MAARVHISSKGKGLNCGAVSIDAYHTIANEVITLMGAERFFESSLGRSYSSPAISVPGISKDTRIGQLDLSKGRWQPYMLAATTSVLLGRVLECQVGI